MWTLDASVIVRSFDPLDAEYAIVVEFLNRLEHDALPIIVPRLVLPEIAGAVRRLLRDPIRARLAVTVWATLPHVQIVTLSDSLLDEAAEIAADRALQ
ncbi:type II toxin-antitoxin system VapC family toxin [Candidatus Oscillochloris fontis]|uniref:type II toxin-antitoxin system VapC family toxin n=1 Tax=Candidatus Oscillochloris fontis TaxID=2496868 RepID=UPI00101C4429|nr:hypothetical protein [Candidatus Oscillochloris fontis]